MANSDIPAGFRPVKHLCGASWSGKTNVYYIPATDGTAMFIGDAVKSAGSADATGKYPTVAQAAATNAIRGVIVGFGTHPNLMANPDNLQMKYRAASTAMYCLVVDDPFVIFEIQEDSVGNSITADMVGLSTDIVVGSGSTITGKSAMELDSSDTATAAGQCKLLNIARREDNALGDNCKWEVLIVEHEMLSSTDV